MHKCMMIYMNKYIKISENKLWTLKFNLNLQKKMKRSDYKKNISV